MTPGSANSGTRGDSRVPPILVLAVGNLLLQDDAAGLEMLAALSNRQLGEDVELVDGGTQGIALLGQLEGRKSIIILDAVNLGAKPGTLHLLRSADLEKMRARKSSTSHESNALELLLFANLLGMNPPVLVVGIEPESVRTGIGLTPNIAAVIPYATEAACAIIQSAKEQRLCA